MKDPREVWEVCAENELWLSDPAVMVGRILRQGYEAGVADALRVIEFTAARGPAVRLDAAAPLLGCALRELLRRDETSAQGQAEEAQAT